MSIEQMRGYVINKYPGPGWRGKVAKMSDNQIIALYHRFVNERKTERGVAGCTR